MFSEQRILELAAELQQAEQSRVQVEHFSKRFPEMTVADGYAISRAWVRMKIAAGCTARGHKIGLISRAMQQASQIGEFLEKGEVVLGGSFTRPTKAAAGDTFHADYGPLGSIAFHFV